MQFKCNVEFLLIRVVINKTINSYSSFGFDWISEALKQQALSEVNVINKFPLQNSAEKHLAACFHLQHELNTWAIVFVIQFIMIRVKTQHLS